MKRLERKESLARYTLYVLAIYIMFQIIWWGTHIIALTAENASITNDPTSATKVYGMIIGEGSVFVLLMLGGFFYIHRTLRREFKLARIQSAFLLSVTHELKTPVAAIKLGVATMRNRKLTDDQTAELLQSIAKETNRLQTLSENILLAAKLDVKDKEELKEPVDFTGLIEKANRAVFSNPKNVVTRLDEACVMQGDEALLQALYVNLVENAIKYNKPNGLVQVNLIQTDEALTLTVQDQGDGIPIQERENVKKKFYRMGNEATRRHQGTGLGLFIVDHIVKLHRATWKIDQGEGGGCLISIRFDRVI